MYPIFVFLMVFAIYFSHHDLIKFEEQLVADDGFFQWTIFSTLIFASILCFWRASILKPFRGAVFATASITLGSIFFIFALDEISWGQRIFNFPSPIYFLEHNTHGQTNVHHLIVNGIYINNLVFTFSVKIIATLYFLIVPYLYPKVEKLKYFFNHYAIPIPRYTQVGAYLVLAIMTGFIKSEFKYVIFEFGFYWILALMMYNPLNEEIFCRKSLIR
jgi:hypothetical protein